MSERYLKHLEKSVGNDLKQLFLDIKPQKQDTSALTTFWVSYQQGDDPGHLAAHLENFIMCLKETFTVSAKREYMHQRCILELLEDRRRLESSEASPIHVGMLALEALVNVRSSLVAVGTVMHNQKSLMNAACELLMEQSMHLREFAENTGIVAIDTRERVTATQEVLRKLIHNIGELKVSLLEQILALCHARECGEKDLATLKDKNVDMASCMNKAESTLWKTEAANRALSEELTTVQNAKESLLRKMEELEKEPKARSSILNKKSINKSVNEDEIENAAFPSAVTPRKRSVIEATKVVQASVAKTPLERLAEVWNVK